MRRVKRIAPLAAIILAGMLTPAMVPVIASGCVPEPSASLPPEPDVRYERVGYPDNAGTNGSDTQIMPVRTGRIPGHCRYERAGYPDNAGTNGPDTRTMPV